MRPFDRDLFGEVIVTHQDVRRWLETVPRINPDGPRAANYMRGYDVVGKIKRAKLEGCFEARTHFELPGSQSPLFWHRLCWY